MHSNKKLAIFDLDYTLTRQGTWGRFSWQLIQFRPHIWIPFLVSALWAQYRYKKGRIPRVDVKRAMMRWSMKGRTKTVLEAAAQKFADTEVPKKLRPGGLETLREYQNNGHPVVIISAAVDILVIAIAKKLGVTHYMGTEMAWDDAGTVLMHFSSPNCYGEEKLVRFDAFLKQNPEFSGLPRIMYSDSHSDIFLMRECEEAVAVHPSKKLKKLATEYGFPIANWN